jgi:hypothetical protein
MLVQAWVQKEKRAEYESAPWQPEPELSQPPPRSVSFSLSTKLVGVLILFVVGIMFCFVCLPSLKHAYLTSYGISTKGAIQERYNLQTGSANRWNHSYYLVVRYETPSGWQLVRIQASRNYYAGSLQSESVPVHYLARIPSQGVLDDDQLYRPWQVLLVLGFGVTLLWLPYYMYRKIRTIAECGIAVKGLMTKINKRLKNRYVTVYYEFQEVPYQATVAVRANQPKPDWQPGKAVTLLVAPDSPSSPHRPHVVMVYPASEFKINPKI